ncbi:GRIP and coiled-coil domain-containing protein 2 [Argiope bruennichi]|uniref:GRIP and coiled-coil domain-containing protein 2 n=1 Tax=Argiope bruennichi TaxID=94029 RepID=A0A8T0E0C0_ARGBR|nr:GRIP and coiled-coil domain-containing protein 2 [Argiope bruennichi]
MAESSDAVQEAEETKKKVVLEEKSKEDLIKIVKKQLTLLQKAKGKTEELSRKCVTIEEEKNQAMEKKESIIIDLQQQLETLELKICNLTETKDLKEEITTLLEARNTAVESLKAKNMALDFKTKNENSSLKDSLNAKSALVERIHSELDAQLGKVEELTEESEMKDKDIIHYQTLSKMLQEELNELKKVFITTSSFMKHMKNALNELQNDNTKLKYDISSLNTSSDDTVSTIRNYLSTTVYEYEKQMKGFSDKCTHMNEVFHYLMLQLDKISEDFGLWLNILISANNMGENIISFPPPDVDINLLKRTYQNLDVNDLFKDKCNSDCCSVINNFKKFEVVKQELLSIMHNNFFMSYQSILNELNEYKNSIVPNLESTAKNLEDKLKASKKDVKEEVLLEQKVEKEDEESSVEDLKKQLADTEIKMTKCKQIALKLKKDLQESKKQEKEKLIAELESKLIILESKKQEEIHKIEELEVGLKVKIEQINNLVEENNNLKAQLQSSQKDENKKNLLHLEMADYERSILELNNKIEKKDDEISDLKQKLSCEIEKRHGLLEEIESTEKLKETEQKRADSLKEVLDKTKSELAVTKERETELLTKVSHLQMQLEIVIQQEEHCKKQIRIMSDEHKRTVNELQKQLESADLEIARLQRDQQKFHGLPLTPIVQDNPVSFDILSQERQEGEFATLSPCSEKAMLIPVLTTMLKLSPAEQQQLKSISGDIDSNEPSGSGWGSYLHRWSGLA